MKSLVKIQSADMQKLLVAASWAGVKVLTSKPMGPKTGVEVQHSTPDQLVEIGGLLVSLKPEEVTAGIAQIVADKKAADEKAAAASKAARPGKR